MAKMIIPLIFICLTVQTTAQEIITGQYNASATSLELLGQKQASSYADILNPDDDISWEIKVPQNYDPSNPPGVLIYVSPQNKIKTPSGWMKATEENNLIWIAPTMSGNQIMPSVRILKATLALTFIQENYKINSKRVYISGFSGGGRIASIIAINYPGIFKGAIYNSGANFWNEQIPARLDLIKENRFVFITGSEDFNLTDTKKVRSLYKKSGVKNTKLMIIRRMGHSNPKYRRFVQAIKYLDN